MIDVSWDDGPDAGRWIAERLAPFGPSLGHAVPLGYAAYALVPVSEFDTLLEALGPDTPVHCGMWDGWGTWYDRGADPRTAPGMSVGIAWSEGDDPPTQEEIDQAREQMATRRVERPDAEPLDLPNRAYYLWTGPLASATAFVDDLPSLIWPDDRSWFVGVPIYTDEIAVAGTTALVDAILADPRLGARRAAPDDVLAGED